MPDLTSKFRENVGMDDMAASPSPASPLDEDDDLDEFVQPKQPQRSKELKRPAIGRSQSDYFQTRRAKSGKTHIFFIYNFVTHMKTNRYGYF